MFKRALENRFEIKTQVIGPKSVGGTNASVVPPMEEVPEVLQEGRVLNRIVRCTNNGWELEPDQRHIDLIVKELGLDDAKGVSSPGEPEKRWGEEENAAPLDEATASRYRAIVARANYLAADRVDMMYSTNEVCRHMANPTAGAWKKLKRLGRYLRESPRTMMVY